MKKIFSLFFITLAQLGFSHFKLPKDSIDLMIGQMIMIGIGDSSLVNHNKMIFSEIKNGKIGGVVLYEKNILSKNSKSELASMIKSLQKNAHIPLFISIDEEGGRVTRMKTKYGFPKNVSAQYLGDMNNLDSTSYYANQTATVLNSFGINMNYAPVVDLNLNSENPIIGKIERSYSSDYTKVVNQAYEVIKQHNKRKVVPVLKHFPGHGSSKSDTHLGLTDVTETWKIEELNPYSALIDSGIVKAIMTAHIVNQILDSTKNPATLSKQIVTGLLREFIGFKGIIISDDMQMGAINNEYGLREAIKMSIEAGIDILIFANNVNANNMVTASTIHAIIKDLLLENVITRSRIYQSYKRIMKLKADIGLCDPNYYRSLKNKLQQHNVGIK